MTITLPLVGRLYAHRCITRVRPFAEVLTGPQGSELPWAALTRAA